MMPATHIFDILENAAAVESDQGISFLEKGLGEEPTHVSYRELSQQAQRRGKLLVEAGVVKSGSITIIYFDNHRENVTWFWSVVAAGGICAILNPVSNDSRTAAGHLDNLKNLFGSTRILTSHRLSAIFATKGLNVQTVEQVERPITAPRSTSEANGYHAPPEKDIAVILFTSGSTGPSKAVCFSHAQLIASVCAKAEYLGTHGKTFMNWTSFDHSASFCEIHLQAMHSGGRQVFVPASDIMVEPYRFFHLLGRFKVAYTFAPNFMLAAVARSMQEQSPATNADLDLGNLSVIMCGGEANSTKTLEAADKVLRQYGAPACSIKAAYGLSETCSACFYNLDTPSYDMTNRNKFATVGKPLPDVLEMRIGDGDESQGLVYLRGDLIFKGYYNNPAATLACMSDDGWMNTGDYGRIDENGNLHLLGRAKEVLILNGQNYSSFEIEHALESSSIAGVESSYTAVFSVWDQERDSEAVVVLFNPTEAAIGPKHLRATVQAIERCVFTICGQMAKHIVALPKAKMPKSTIGKLSRAKLKQQFEAGAFEDFILERLQAAAKTNGPSGDTVAHQSLDDLTPLQQEISRIYASVVNVSPEDLIGPDALLSSGINSIGLMRLKKALEKGLKIQQDIPMPLLIRCHSIVELEHELVCLGTVPQEYDPIVPLTTTGSKQALFLLHPGSGEFLCWIGLSKYLLDRPLYAVRARGVYPGEANLDSLQDVLDCYYTAIRRTQPRGPYALLGYCFGGMLTFELSKMLESAGEQVVFCGGVDNPPSLRQTIGQLQYRSLMVDVLPVVSDLTEDEARAFGDETAGLTDDEFFAVLYTKFPAEFIESMGLTIPRLQAYGRVEDCMRLIASKYDPEGEVGTTDIFCADPMPHFGATPEVWRRDVLGQWAGFVKGKNVKFHQITGSHISAVKEPYVQEFGKALNKALIARGI